MSHVTHPILTIGHSNLVLSDFLELLQQNLVTAVVDVRSQPYSRFNPAYGRESIKKSLRSNGIEYVFMGRELGARTSDPECYVDGQVQYGILARTNQFKEGIDRVVAGADRHCIALMCAERDPLQCHRAILVARVLNERGLSVSHIHSDGRLETHENAMRRLLNLVGLPTVDLFRTWAELLDEGLRLQESKIAYVNKNMARKQEIRNL